MQICTEFGRHEEATTGRHTFFKAGRGCKLQACLGAADAEGFDTDDSRKILANAPEGFTINFVHVIISVAHTFRAHCQAREPQLHI
jgi:hypothetical protein